MGSYADRSGRMRMRGGRRSSIGTLVAALVFVWLIIGAIAGGQRHYYDNAPTNCASTGTIAATIFAGPLNYTGLNPKIDDCNVNLPQPSP